MGDLLSYLDNLFIQCNRCHLQYVGATMRRLKDRFNEHRRSVDKTNIKSKPTLLPNILLLILIIATLTGN